MVFHWCLYNKQNITCPLMDMNFIFSWSTRYLTRSLRSLVRYRVDHSKIKFISTRGHVISSIYLVLKSIEGNWRTRNRKFRISSWGRTRQVFFFFGGGGDETGIIRRVTVIRGFAEYGRKLRRGYT